MHPLHTVLELTVAGRIESNFTRKPSLSSWFGAARMWEAVDRNSARRDRVLLNKESAPCPKLQPPSRFERPISLAWKPDQIAPVDGSREGLDPEVCRGGSITSLDRNRSRSDAHRNSPTSNSCARPRRCSSVNVMNLKMVAVVVSQLRLRCNFPMSYAIEAPFMLESGSK